MGQALCESGMLRQHQQQEQPEQLVPICAQTCYRPQHREIGFYCDRWTKRRNPDGGVNCLCEGLGTGFCCENDCQYYCQ